MMPDAASVGNRSSDSGAIVAAIDDIDGSPHLVVADITRDDVWIAMGESEAVSVDEIR